MKKLYLASLVIFLSISIVNTSVVNANNTNVKNTSINNKFVFNKANEDVNDKQNNNKKNRQLNNSINDKQYFLVGEATSLGGSRATQGKNPMVLHHRFISKAPYSLNECLKIAKNEIDHTARYDTGYINRISNVLNNMHRYCLNKPNTLILLNEWRADSSMFLINIINRRNEINHEEYNKYSKYSGNNLNFISDKEIDKNDRGITEITDYALKIEKEWSRPSGETYKKYNGNIVEMTYVEKYNRDRNEPSYSALIHSDFIEYKDKIYNFNDFYYSFVEEVENSSKSVSHVKKQADRVNHIYEYTRAYYLEEKYPNYQKEIREKYLQDID